MGTRQAKKFRKEIRNMAEKQVKTYYDSEIQKELDERYAAIGKWKIIALGVATCYGLTILAGVVAYYMGVL